MSDATVNGDKATLSYMTEFDKKSEKLPVSQPLLKTIKNSRRAYYLRVSQKKKENPDHGASGSGTKGDTDKKSRQKEIEEANNQIQVAERIRKEAMDLLQMGIEAKDFNKVSTANAILERSHSLFKTVKKRKLEAEKQLPLKRKK